MAPDSPSFRDLYESQTATDGKIEKVNERLSRLERGFIVLGIAVLSPKLGGPDVATVIGSLLGV